MISTLLVSRKKSLFSDIKNVLAESLIKTAWSRTGTKALSMLSKQPVDLLIIEENLSDMTGKKFIKTVVMKNPMTNCVVASSLSHKKFHEEYEGFGILMQLPIEPGPKDAQELIEHLKLVFHL